MSTGLGYPRVGRGQTNLSKINNSSSSNDGQCCGAGSFLTGSGFSSPVPAPDLIKSRLSTFKKNCIYNIPPSLLLWTIFIYFLICLSSLLERIALKKFLSSSKLEPDLLLIGSGQNVLAPQHCTWEYKSGGQGAIPWRY